MTDQLKYVAIAELCLNADQMLTKGVALENMENAVATELTWYSTEEIEELFGTSKREQAAQQVIKPFETNWEEVNETLQGLVSKL